MKVKRMFIPILTVASCLALLMTPCAAQTNLVVNGGFETSPTLGAVPSGWTRITNSFGLYDGRYGGMAAHSGTWMMHTGNNYLPGGEYQDLTLEQGKSYRLTFWARNWSGKGTGQGQVIVGTPGSNSGSLTLNNNAECVSSIFNVLDNAWTQYTYDFVATASGIRLSLINYFSGGAISIDDVSLINTDVVYTLGGTVRDASGQPIAGAEVAISNTQAPFVSPSAQTTTATDGTYSVSVVPGTWYIAARKAGYTPNPSQSTQVTPTSNISGIDFTLTYLGASLIVNGGFEQNQGDATIPTGWSVITNCYGAYAGSATIATPHAGSWMLHAGASHAPGGAYQDVLTVPGAAYTLVFWTRGWQGDGGSQQGRVQVGTRGTDNNSLTLNNQAECVNQTINVLESTWAQSTIYFNAVGSRTRLSFQNVSGAINVDDVQLYGPAPVTYTLSGTVRDTNATPIAGATVAMSDIANPLANASATTTTAPDGTYSFVLTSGTYYLAARKDSCMPDPSPDVTATLANSNVSGVDFTLQVMSHIADYKSLPAGTSVSLYGKAVTLAPAVGGLRSTDWFYVEDSDRISGIRVENGISTMDDVRVNEVVNLKGTLQVKPVTGEKYLLLTQDPNGDMGTELKPYGATTKSIQLDPKLRSLLVRVGCKVTEKSTDGTWFKVSDGYSVETTVAIYGDSKFDTLDVGDTVTLTGIVTTSDAGDTVLLHRDCKTLAPKVPASQTYSFSTGFEVADGFTTGAADGQNGCFIGWNQTSNGAATIITSADGIVAGGQQALRLSQPNHAIGPWWMSGFELGVPISGVPDVPMKYAVLSMKIWRDGGQTEWPAGSSQMHPNSWCNQFAFYTDTTAPGVNGRYMDAGDMPDSSSDSSFHALLLNTTPRSALDLGTVIIGGRYVEVVVFDDYVAHERSMWYDGQLMANQVPIPDWANGTNSLTLWYGTSNPWVAASGLSKPCYVDDIRLGYDIK